MQKSGFLTSRLISEKKNDKLKETLNTLQKIKVKLELQ